MKKIKEIIISMITLVFGTIFNIFKSIGCWFWSIILEIYHFLKSIVVGIYNLLFKTTLKQKLVFITVICFLGGCFFVSRLNDLSFYSLDENSRVIEEGKLVDLDYRRLKEDKKYLTFYEDAEYLARIELTTTNIEILNKKTDVSYNTLSPLVKSDALKTPFILTYKLKDSTATQTLNAMTGSVNEGTYQVFEIENGVRVDYTVGDSKFSLNDLPRFIAPEKFENKILNVVSDESKELVEKYYKYSKDRDVYYPVNPRGDARRVYEAIFYEAEYTFEDLSEDIYAYTGKDGAAQPKATFTFPIEYTFNKGKLNVNVLFQTAEFHEDFQIVMMDLLPSFGATLNGDNAYALLPDGTGGIVDLNGVKGNNNVYIKSLYNNTELLEAPKKQFDEKATMPIYGISDENQGVFAIIRQGAEKTNLVLTVSNDPNEPNRIFPRIQNVDVYNHDFYGDGSTMIRYYSDNKTSEYSIEYSLLNQNNNDYFTLANIYRDYLINTYGLDVQEEISSGILVDIIGGIKREHNVMGIQFDKVEYATTYAEAIEILDELKQIPSLATVYSGWMNGGYIHDLPTTIKLDRAAGGKSEFEKLVSYIDENNLNHYFDISFIETFTKNDNGFRADAHGIKNVPNEILKRNVVQPNTLLENKKSLTSYFIAPNYINSVVESYLNELEFDLSGLALRNIGSMYYANYGKNAMEFSQAQAYLEDVLTKLTNEGHNLLINNGYNFTFPFSSYQTNLPLGTSQNGVIDYVIPFQNIAYNGLFDYSGESVNIGNSASLEKNILKSIEFGMDVKYTVSHQNSSFFSNTDYTYYYDTEFNNLKDEIYSTSDSINKSKEILGNGHITGHERLMNDVFKVSYKNGKTLIFNYNNESVEVSGRTIPGLGYIVE